MKRLLIICIALLLPVAGLAWMNVTTVGGGVVPAAGGAAANQSVNPDAVVSAGDWLDHDFEAAATANIAFIASYDSPNDATHFIGFPEPTSTIEIGFVEPSAGTISTVRAHVRAKNGASTGNETIAITGDGGSNWTSGVDIGSLTGSAANYTVDFTSLGWSGATDLRARIVSANAGWTYVYEIKLEINP